MAVEKRIPVGAKVRWQSRYESDPVHEGVVVQFYRAHPYEPAYYHVEATTGRPSRRQMMPNAANLEAQNPTKLKRVK